MVKTEKISNTVLAATIGVSAVIFVLFLCIGYDEPFEANPDYNAPVLTDLFLGLMYALVLAVTGCCIWSVIHSMQQGNKGGNDNRVPAGKVSLITWGLLIASIVIGLVLGLGESDFRAADGTITEASWVTVVDLFMWSMYILSAALVILVVVSMAGVIARTNKV